MIISSLYRETEHADYHPQKELVARITNLDKYFLAGGKIQSHHLADLTVWDKKVVEGHPPSGMEETGFPWWAHTSTLGRQSLLPGR